MSPKNLSSIGDLKRDPRNPRKHGERNLQQIEQSLKNFGAGRSIVIDEKNQILAGNGLVEAAGNIGLSKLVVVDATGEEIVAVRRRGLTERQKSEYRIADNRSAELAEWDPEVLAAMVEEINLEQFWSAEELEALLAEEPEQSDVDAEPQTDRAAELQEQWKAERGQVWQLGNHRLMCGDATKAEDVARLMNGAKAKMVFADPPFGISYAGHGASKDGRANKFRPIIGDTKANSAWIPFCVLEVGAVYLKTHFSVLAFWKSELAKICSVKSIIVWNRCSHSAGDVIGGYATQTELILFGVFGKHKINAFDTDLWSIPRATTGAPENRTGHPYESPTALPLRAITNSTQPGEIVFDPFLGSGTTLIAAEQLNRRCFAMEIEERYVSVCLQRFQDATEKEPELLK